MTENKDQTIRAEDLYEFELVAGPQLSPDGDKVVYSVTWVDRKKEKKYSNLWIGSSDGGGNRPFTSGNHVDSFPRWSPDGEKIAFISNRDDKDQPQIYLIPTDGGEATKLTDVKGDIQSLEWSPDGQNLLCQFRKKDQDVIDREEDDQKKELGIVYRHITRVFFRYDGQGYLPEEQLHIWSFDSSSGQGRQLTQSEDRAERSPIWSPDGERIAFLLNTSPDPDLDPDAVDLFTMPAKGGEPRQIKTPFGFKEFPSYSPDGKWLAYLAQEGRGNWWQNVALWVVPADGSAPAKNLTGEYDIYVGNGTIGDIADRPTVAPVWTQDNQSIVFQVTRHGNTTLQAVDRDGRNLRTIIDRTGVVGAWTTDRSGLAISYAFSSPDDPGQIYVQSAGQTKQVTNLNKRLLKERNPAGLEELWLQGPDGNDLQGWIVKPPDFDPSRKYPSILQIHGGPYLQYGNLFFHEFQYLAAQGYVVYLCNPRGGQGYGEDHSKAIHQKWGTVDYADLMAMVDYMVKQPYIDREKLGVAGGSYGGYMTTWIVGHTDRFKAAAAQRVVSNTISFTGTSDVNWEFYDPWGGGTPPWEDLEGYWAQSPIAFIGNVKTPTMVIHSEQDMRCDPEQGVQVFVALKRLGVDTELLLFPEESHGLSRAGRTDRRVARLRHIARWFDKYLKD